MFILHYPNGQTLTEKNGYWDDQPEGLSGMELTLPFKAKARKATGEIVILPARTIAITGFDKYFYSKEAISQLAVGSKSLDKLANTQSAEIMGGVKKDFAIKIRVDKNGNIKVTYHKPDTLDFASQAFKQGASK